MKANKKRVSTKTASLLGREKIDWQEILWEYAEEFLGEEEIKYKYHTPDWKQGKFIMMRQYEKMSKYWVDKNEQIEKNLIKPFGGTNNAICQIVSEEIIRAVEYLPKTFAEKHTDDIRWLIAEVQENAREEFAKELVENLLIKRLTEIKNLLQQKKYEEADLYFREHCRLINN